MAAMEAEMDEGGGGMENIALNVCVNSNNKDGAWKQVFKKSKQNKVMTTGNANVAEDEVASCSSGNRENENINNDECAVRNSVAKMTRSREEDDTMGYKRRRVNDDSVRYTAEHTVYFFLIKLSKELTTSSQPLTPFLTVSC
ncbi:uncharacterized protein LOC131995200 [Stomoxys calcitrans]|uniref:uncharacterized protein LOC131995200 n=1 Tax=Stomoxys calcitrans TaxID=35570 RepID=UPI0027E2F3AB|nr:uncharacterized protein LOC131995200 [Stomoxys calcitrans]